MISLISRPRVIELYGSVILDELIDPNARVVVPTGSIARIGQLECYSVENHGDFEYDQGLIERGVVERSERKYPTKDIEIGGDIAGDLWYAPDAKIKISPDGNVGLSRIYVDELKQIGNFDGTAVVNSYQHLSDAVTRGTVISRRIQITSGELYGHLEGDTLVTEGTAKMDVTTSIGSEKLEKIISLSTHQEG